MSKKHFQAMADALHQERKYRGSDGVTYDDAIRIVARVFKSENPRFNESLFLEACATGKCRGMKARS